jgi:metallo-beta-lactamase class B
MKASIKAVLILVFFVTITNCNAQQRSTFKPGVIYKSDHLIITQLSANSFEHTSFLQTNDFGNVPCNGLIVKDSNETIVFDTPANDKESEELISWIKNKLQCSVKAIIPTHFHNDCLGGLKAFHDHSVPSYAYVKTIALARENNAEIPQNSFTDPLTLHVGNKEVVVTFFGEGHTKDNTVGYFPSENILFGGCLIKERGAGKGFLGDANTAAWPGTVEKVKKAYPHVSIVVPGHGEYGNKKLLDYTISLFKTKL